MGLHVAEIPSTNTECWWRHMVSPAGDQW